LKTILALKTWVAQKGSGSNHLMIDFARTQRLSFYSWPGKNPSLIHQLKQPGRCPRVKSG
jgi:hypothetical protein